MLVSQGGRGQVVPDGVAALGKFLGDRNGIGRCQMWRLRDDGELYKDLLQYESINARGAQSLHVEITVLVEQVLAVLSMCVGGEPLPPRINPGDEPFYP